MPPHTPPPSNRPLERLLRAENAAWLRLLSSSLSHALGSGLQVVGGRASLVEASGAQGEDARIIARKVREMTELLQTVQRHARRGAAPATTTPLDVEVAALVELMGPVAESRGLSLVVQALEPLSVLARTDDVLVALVALSAAGLSSCAQNGVTWTITRVDRSPPPEEAGVASGGEVVQLVASWPGGRPTLSALVHAREPWLAPPKGIDNDVALQLALVYGIARESGGWIEWRQADDTTLSLYLPLAR